MPRRLLVMLALCALGSFAELPCCPFLPGPMKLPQAANEALAKSQADKAVLAEECAALKGRVTALEEQLAAVAATSSSTEQMRARCGRGWGCRQGGVTHARERHFRCTWQLLLHAAKELATRLGLRSMPLFVQCAGGRQPAARRGGGRGG